MTQPEPAAHRPASRSTAEPPRDCSIRPPLADREGQPNRPARGAQVSAQGWAQSARTVDVYTMPGDHGTMLKEPHVQMLVELLRQCLASAAEDDLTR